jgi:hypothetical protein
VNNNHKHLKRLRIEVALLVLIGTLLGLLAGTEAQPAQASLLARKTRTPTPTPTATRTATPTATPPSAGTPTPTPVPGPNGVWNVVSSPNTGSPHNELYGVAAIASNNVWAVGAYGVFGNAAQQIIEHWNGTSWSIMPARIPVPCRITSCLASQWSQPSELGRWTLTMRTCWSSLTRCHRTTVTRTVDSVAG